MSSPNLSSAAANAGRKVDQVARDSFEEVKGAVQAKAGEALNTIQQAGAQAGRVVKQTYEDLRDTAGQQLGQGRAMAEEWEQTLEDRIRERPLSAILLAAGVGLAIGYLMYASNPRR